MLVILRSVVSYQASIRPSVKQFSCTAQHCIYNEGTYLPSLLLFLLDYVHPGIAEIQIGTEERILCYCTPNKCTLLHTQARKRHPLHKFYCELCSFSLKIRWRGIIKYYDHNHNHHHHLILICRWLVSSPKQLIHTNYFQSVKTLK